MARRIQDLDWSSTLGSIDQWPRPLRTAVDMCLASRHQLAIYWGPELVLLYNDAEIEALGSLHPWALGRPAREVLAEFWDVVEPMFRRVLEQCEATWSEDQPLTFHRQGEPEQRYFTWSYSPIPDDLGGVGGVLLVTTDTTDHVLQARRLRLLHELAIRVPGSEDATVAARAACSTLAGGTPDVQFAALYLADEAGACLAATAGIAGEIGEDGPDGVRADRVWPLVETLETRAPRAIELMPAGSGISWTSDGLRRALAVPFTRLDRDEAAGVVVLGLDPLRPLDESYTEFLELVAAEIGVAIGAADARASERRRLLALEELARAKNVFFGDVSHELRTPLAVILGTLEEVSDIEAERPARDLIEVAARNARRLAQLVNSLSDMAQIDAGGAKPVYAPTDLARLTTDLSSSFRSVVEQAGLALRLDCQRLGEPVYVDAGAWEKIVLNLLSNAVKYTLTGEISVTLQRHGAMAELVVVDTGIGIPERELPRLFQRFHRVRDAVGRSQEGAGIGLALVHELVGLHGGAVTVESLLGLGTAVTVRVPFGSSHLSPEHLSDAPAPGAVSALAAHIDEVVRWLPEPVPAVAADAAAPDVRADLPHILVADDDADLRAYLARLLGSRWRVTTEADSSTALAHALDEAPDLLVTDLAMDGEGGLALLRALRADSRTAALPVIVLSAQADEATAVEVLEAGADDYIVKPFTGRELVARIGAIIEVTRLRRDAARQRGEIEAAQAGMDRLAGLQSVSAAFAVASSPEEIAQVIANQGAAALGARASAVALESRGGVLEVVGSMSAGAGPGGFEEDARAAIETAFRTGRVYVAEALVAAPLRAGARLRGAVVFALEGPPVSTTESERFAELLAQECGLALDRAERTQGHAAELERILGELRTAQARTLAAADDERRRIERDIHDGAQQQIVAVRVKLGLAERALSSADLAQASHARVMILESGRALEAALHDLRRLAHGVFPRILADEGLPSALSAVARQAAIPATVEARDVGRLPVEIESAAYYCCLEALQNAAKHAGPDASVHTRVSLEGSGGLEIEIADDGKGFHLDAERAGAGLTNMRDRVAACGGTLRIESAPGAGTRIRAFIPAAAGVARDLTVR
jgi:signal transduction histidine kinase/CheY-like chemotaxis protein